MRKYPMLVRLSVLSILLLGLNSEVRSQAAHSSPWETFDRQCGEIQATEALLDRPDSDANLRRYLPSVRLGPVWAVARSRIRHLCSLKSSEMSEERILSSIPLAQRYQASFAIDTIIPQGVAPGSAIFEPKFDSAALQRLEAVACDSAYVELVPYYPQGGRKNLVHGYVLLASGNERLYRELFLGVASFPNQFKTAQVTVIAFIESPQWQSDGRYVRSTRDLTPPWKCPVEIHLQPLRKR